MFDNRQTKAKIIAAASVQNEQLIEALCEVERLQVENWQLKQACGYSIPADKETPQNPFKCGTCDAKTIELVELRAVLERANMVRQFPR